MGAMGRFFFGEEDSFLVGQISSLHKAPKELVEKYYKIMLDAIKVELQK